jgi:small subunit ribosomal protein S35
VKRVLTVAVSQLPLKDERAIHKFCLLAGVRWTPTPPKDGGIKPGESAEHGYVKISCEDFPEPAMNLKWVSDRLDDLINEANVRSFFFPLNFELWLTGGSLTQKDDDRFKDIPIDWRHLEARAEKAKKGKLKRDIAGGAGRYVSPPSIRDFPKSWLPSPSDKPQTPSSGPLHH